MQHFHLCTAFKKKNTQSAQKLIPSNEKGPRQKSRPKITEHNENCSLLHFAKAPFQ